MLRLWGGGTSRTLRAHWMLQELGLDYEARLIGPRSGETRTAQFTALNVKEKIPVLVDDDLVLTESAAIVSYLGMRYGDGEIVPARVSARASYDEWVSYVLMELDAHTLYVMRKHQDLKALYGEAPAAIETAIAGFNKQVRFAEARLTNADYLVEAHFTGADILLGSTLDWAVYYGFQLAPALCSYRQRLRQRPAYAAAVSANELPTADSPG